MNQVKVLSTRLSDTYFPMVWYTLAEENHFWFQWRFNVFMRQCRLLHIDRESSLKGLEVGCGNGVMRRQIENNTNWTVDGADLFEEALRLNNTKRGQTFLYDINDRHQCFKDFYDFIVVFDVLEHVKDAKYFLQSILFHLKPRGWLIINVPALQLLFSPYDYAAGHVKRYNKKMMRQELSSSYLTIIGLCYWGSSLVPLLLARKLLFGRRISNNPEAMIRKGFEVPNSWVNAYLLKIMRMETMLMKSPPFGTSLMTTAIKLDE